MPHITPDSLACIVWTLRWSSPEASHEERWLARRVAFRRDLFPEGMQQALMGAGVGDVVGLDYPAGTALPLHQEQDVLALRPDQLRAITVAQRSVPLSEGRFYPRGLIMAQPDIFPEDQRPFRLLQNSSAGVLADLNHPMAGRACRLEAEVLEVADPAGESGGQLQHWLEAIIDWGPGMQCRHQGRPTVFCPDSPLSRSDSAPDSVFYAQPRLVEHVDAQAREHLAAVYGRHLTPGARVLDLMSSVQSHLPPPESTPQGLHVTGLGLNLAELEANPRLDARLVHDCNAAPSLPFADAAFDLVLCSLSVEYLVAPLAVFAEVRRVLTPGGRFLVSFSDRWFPTKVAGCWPDLHPFERMGQVLHWLLECGGFSDLRTLSIRNWWRPADDPYYGQLSTSDPVFLVSGGLVSGGKSA